MASNILEQYAYYIFGRRFALVQQNSEITGSAVERVSTRTSLWQSPSKSVEDGILLEYSVLPKSKDGGEIVDESDDIDIDDYVAVALADYVRHRYLMDQNELEQSEYYLRKFREKIGTNENTRIYQESRVFSPSVFSIT